MGAITIGCAATDRSTVSSSYTMVNMGGPASGTGVITSVEVWFYSNATGFEVGIFYVVSGNYLSTRSSHSIGNVTGGSKQTFSGLSLAVVAGDYLGYYAATGSIRRDASGGSGLWYKQNDNIPCTNIAFLTASGEVISLYGTGIETQAGGPLFFGGGLG